MTLSRAVDRKKLNFAETHALTGRQKPVKHNYLL
jgi:hypothetical protein